MLKELKKAYHLIATYAWLNLKAEASKTYLSYIWWILEPLLFVAIFYFVFEVLLQARRADFQLFLIVGKIPFLWIIKSMNNAAGSVLQNRGLLGQTTLQPALFPLVVVHEALIKQLPVFLLLIVFVLGYGITPTLTWLWFVPVVFSSLLLIMVLALMAAFMTAFIPDIKLVVQMFSLFLMFSSGIFWSIRDMPDQHLVDLLLIWNPVAFLIDAYRQVLMYQQAPDMQHLAILSLLCMLMISAMFALFARYKSAITTRVVCS